MKITPEKTGLQPLERPEVAFIVWKFKHWISEFDPKLNVAEEHLFKAHYSHFLLAAGEMNADKNQTM